LHTPVGHPGEKIRIRYPSVGRISAPAIPAVYKSIAQFITCHAAAGSGSFFTRSPVTRESLKNPSSPRNITELLTGIIRGMSPNPEQTFKQTTFITKRIYDPTPGSTQHGYHPWRRSPIWLILRVVLQTTLHDLNLDERFGYKSFILYAHSVILSAAARFNKHDHLFAMNAKFARRAWKLSHSGVTRDGHFTIDAAVAVNTLVSDELEERWKRIQQGRTRQIEWEVPRGQDLMVAARMKLAQSSTFLKMLKNSGVALHSRVRSMVWVVPGGKDYKTRSIHASGDLSGLAIPPIPAKIHSAPFERTIHLYDFECWVADTLRVVGLHQIDAINLSKALHDYISAALAHYSGNPERISVAFLTILEVWVFLDRQTIDWAPKLKDFSPEIPVHVFDPLLLPLRSQMERLSCVEVYLEQRHHEGQGRSAIFYDTTDAESFVSLFVSQSTPLQTLLQRMEHDEEQGILRKEQAMVKVNAHYEAVQAEMDAAICTRYTYRYQDHPSCRKCQKREELSRIRYVHIVFFLPSWLTVVIRIAVFERILPADEIRRKCVAFELQTPYQFAVWRDATYTVLQACSGTLDQINDRGFLPCITTYPGYKSYLSRAYAGRKLELAAACRVTYSAAERPLLTLARIIKSHSMSDHQISVNGRLVSNPFSAVCSDAFRYLRTTCAMEVTHDGPYNTLRFAVEGTTHTSNQIVSSQHECSTIITLHDYEAFGHLRAGHKLQWRSMLKEIRRMVLSLSHSDVHILFLQAMWQVEAKSKSGKWYREAHADVVEPVFGLEAVEEMTSLLYKIKDNWTWCFACGTLIAMAARILSTTDEQSVQSAAITFLRQARGVVHQWLKEIIKPQMSDTLVDDTKMANRLPAEANLRKQRQVLLVALVCCSTFNVDDAFIDRVFEPVQDISLIVECRNLICLNRPPNRNSLPFALRMLVERDELLALRFLPRLAACIDTLPAGRNGLDEGIRALWDGYSPSGKWSAYKIPYERWYRSRTAEKGGLKGVDVHYNLLGMQPAAPICGLH
jgi:hypothetical protein